MRLSTELAWDITDWDVEADLSEANIIHNLGKTFLENGLIMPASIICRDDQESKLVRMYSSKYQEYGLTGIRRIVLPFGEFNLKVLPLSRTQITYTKAVR